MQLVCCQDGRLETLPLGELRGAAARTLWTGLPALERLLPHQALRGGSLHEILTPEEGAGGVFWRGCWRRRRGAGGRGGRVVWCDPYREFFPPALRGVPLERLILLRCLPREVLGAAAECLHCKGVAASVAPVAQLTRGEARRLQLAAERGGGLGVLLRPGSARREASGAAIRWWVQPVPGERTCQRWAVELLYGHGGRIGYPVILEASREVFHVRAFDAVAYRPAAATAAIPA